MILKYFQEMREVSGGSPWASSFGTDFNFDFSVGFTEEQQREGGIEYNYWREKPLVTEGVKDPFAAMSGTDPATYTRERPGLSTFVLEDGVVYHNYSAIRVEWMPFGACSSG